MAKSFLRCYSFKWISVHHFIYQVHLLDRHVIEKILFQDHFFISVKQLLVIIARKWTLSSYSNLKIDYIIKKVAPKLNISHAVLIIVTFYL
jgi:hypothetical protein